MLFMLLNSIHIYIYINSINNKKNIYIYYSKNNMYFYIHKKEINKSIKNTKYMDSAENCCFCLELMLLIFIIAK